MPGTRLKWEKPEVIDFRHILVHKMPCKRPTAFGLLSPDLYSLSGLVNAVSRIIWGIPQLDHHAQDSPRRRRQRHAAFPGQGAGKRRFPGFAPRQRDVGLSAAA